MSMFTVQKRARSAAKPKQLRRQGLLPMALVERTHETMLIQAPMESLREAMRHADGLGRVDLRIEGEERLRKAIVKHVEQDPMRHELLHVTLQEVAEDDFIKIDVPVVAIHEPEVMQTMDLLLTQVTDHVKVRGKVSDLPERIEVDLSQLQEGGHVEAGQIELPAGVELISSPDATLFSLRAAALVTEEPTPVGEEPSEEEAREETSETATDES